MLPTSAGVYRFTSVCDGKVYIGSAANIRVRTRHNFGRLKAGKHRNRHLQSAWNRYGVDNFQFQVLLYCDPRLAVFYEQRAIDVLARQLGRLALYNISLTAGSTLGSTHSEATKRKIGLANKGKPGHRRVVPDAERLQISHRMRGNTYMRGKTIPPIVRSKISASLMGHKHTSEARAKISRAGRGRQVSDETRAKLRASQLNVWLGRSHSEQTKAKISARKKGQSPWITGRKHSEESKAKMRAAKTKVSRAGGGGIVSETPAHVIAELNHVPADS